MLETLERFLIDNTTPELKDSIKAAHEILERINVPELDNIFEAHLMTSDAFGEDITMNTIFESTRTLLHDVLKQHTITMDEDTPLDTLTKTVSCLVRVDDYEDRQSVINLCLAEMRPEEAIADILSLTSGWPVEEFLLHIQVASPSLITRIKELMTNVPLPEHDDPATQELRDKIVRDYRYFINMCEGITLLSHDMIKDGMAVGYPFLTYAEQVGRGLEGMYPVRAAQELIGMAILSRDGNANPRTMIIANLENYVASASYATKILIEVDKILNHYKP